MKIRLAGTVNDSIVDGPGFRFTVFVQGCPHHCEGCHNPHTHDFSGGYDGDTDELFEKIISNPLLDGVTFSGGEPMCQAKALCELAKMIKNETSLDIITFTGFEYEYLIANSDNENCYSELLSYTDYLIDGKFEQDKKSYELRFKGSTNQRIIDVKKTCEQGTIVTANL